MNVISFTCDFPMFAWKRARTNAGRFFNDSRLTAYKVAVGYEARSAMKNQPPMTTPCRMEIYGLFKVPDSWPKWKQQAAMGKPYTCVSDFDNHIKAVSDALNKIVYIDDRLVSHGSIERFYSDRDQFRVTIMPLEGVPVTRPCTGAIK